ncbi:MAG: ATP-binding cassette domain-containing protein [Deltaproteobacteria bacterium]|nr:ATP-binding cassette domain-containing protein [Deltaproteobacteria bacterium]
MLELSEVSKCFGELTVIEKASLKVRVGGVLCLLGPSGVGKTTLLEIMAGLTKADSGRVTLKTPPSILFQDNLLIPWLNALDNVTYILPKALPAEEARLRAERWLDTFELPPDKFPRALSGGMKRRLALARTMAAGRSLLILDEPFAFLDKRWHETIASLVAYKANNGAAAVISGHWAPETLPALLPGRLETVRFTGQPINLAMS